MNNYDVSINGNRAQHVRAGNARVAVNKAMQQHKESAFKPSATIVVYFIGKVDYYWDIVAKVSCARLKVDHPDWQFVRCVKRAVEL